jgi:hypothetical protein
MTNLTFNSTTLSILVLLTLSVYLVILFVFISARRKYKGGIVEMAIRFIIASIVLLFLADATLFFIPLFGLQPSYVLHVFLKISAMVCLAVAGLKLFAR